MSRPPLAAKWKSIIYIYHLSLYPRNYRHVIKFLLFSVLILPHKIIVSRHNYLCILFLSNQEMCFRIFDIINGWIELDSRSLNSPCLQFLFKQSKNHYPEYGFVKSRLRKSKSRSGTRLLLKSRDGNFWKYLKILH